MLLPNHIVEIFTVDIEGQFSIEESGKSVLVLLAEGCTNAEEIYILERQQTNYIDMAFIQWSWLVILRQIGPNQRHSKQQLTYVSESSYVAFLFDERLNIGRHMYSYL